MTRNVQALATLVALTSLVAAGCGGNKDDGTDGTTDTDTDTDTTTDTPTTDTTDTATTTDADIVDLQVVPGDIPGVMIATFTSTEGTPRVEYGLDATLGTSTPAGASGTSHEIVVLGVKTGKTYQFQAVVETASGEERSALVEARVDSADVSVPLWDLLSEDESKQCTPGGFVLVSHIGANNSGVMIIDRDGDIVWSQPAPPPPDDCPTITYHQVSRVRPGPTADAITYTTADGDRIQQCGTIVEQPMDGSASTTTFTDVSHHDFVILPDNSYGWLGYDFGPYDNCLEKGMTLKSTAVDIVATSPRGGANNEATEVFNSFTDYGNPLKCDFNDENFLQAAGYFDLTHANSLMYRESDDAFFMMWRWHDNLIKIDRATGDKVWEFGGTYSDFTPAKGQDPAELYNHSHMSEIWDGGLFIFNNNDYGPDDPGPSYVQEYALDETNMTYEVTWNWNTGGFENLLGDARRMPYTDCDNVIISLSRSGIVQEMTRDEEVVWQAGMPIGNVSSRVHFIPDIYDMTTGLYPE